MVKNIFKNQKEIKNSSESTNKVELSDFNTDFNFKKYIKSRIQKSFTLVL